MNIQYKPRNPLYNSQVIGGSQTDILYYVLTRNAEIDVLYGEYKEGYIFIDETPKEDVLKNIKHIHFDSDYGEVIEKLPSWVYDTKHIKALSVSIDLLTNQELVNSDFFSKS